MIFMATGNVLRITSIALSAALAVSSVAVRFNHSESPFGRRDPIVETRAHTADARENGRQIASHTHASAKIAALYDEFENKDTRNGSITTAENTAIMAHHEKNTSELVGVINFYSWVSRHPDASPKDKAYARERGISWRSRIDEFSLKKQEPAPKVDPNLESAQRAEKRGELLSAATYFYDAGKSEDTFRLADAVIQTAAQQTQSQLFQWSSFLDNISSNGKNGQDKQRAGELKVLFTNALVAKSPVPVPSETQEENSVTAAHTREREAKLDAGTALATREPGKPLEEVSPQAPKAEEPAKPEPSKPKTDFTQMVRNALTSGNEKAIARVMNNLVINGEEDSENYRTLEAKLEEIRKAKAAKSASKEAPPTTKMTVGDFNTFFTTTTVSTIRRYKKEGRLGTTTSLTISCTPARNGTLGKITVTPVPYSGLTKDKLDSLVHDLTTAIDPAGKVVAIQGNVTPFTVTITVKKQ